LLTHISEYTLLQHGMEEAILESFERKTMPRDTQLVGHGRVCQQLYFIESGALRGHYLLKGKEITYWFAFENDFATSLHSFITRQPAVESISLLEDSELLSISKEKLDKLLARFPQLEKVLRMTYERYYLRLEERFVNAQFKTAKERYDELMQTHPRILQRAPLGAVATYLGITQETLSRIRSRR
jgi:CRP-like cAMP-binding protein